MRRRTGKRLRLLKLKYDLRKDSQGFQEQMNHMQ